jgi:hypothetical protein
MTRKQITVEPAAQTPGPAVAKVVVRVEYANGAFRELTAISPQPFLMRAGATAEEAGLPPGLVDPSRKEPLVAIVFGGNSVSGGIQVRQAGTLLPEN